ncbi:unnamed protein product [Spirodela intermedia]|uniref:TYRAAT2-like C-terminal domain-containing protein n=1 Tax=Spirodela intermedia TaxID=51605 RepID=A0A7I8J5U2_SPIIN|nr:unnamed protein product [Spirodela intermedia]CAA6665608.1 unnamed protein product [Spirodela intermedia]
MCEQQPDVVLLCSSILSTEAILRSIPMHKLKPDTIFADVLSVKQYPRNLFLEVNHQTTIILHYPPSKDDLFRNWVLEDCEHFLELRIVLRGSFCLQQVLPPEFGVICTHPMFGPESGKNGWGGLPFVFDNVRISENGGQARKCAQFLGIFEREVQPAAERIDGKNIQITRSETDSSHCFQGCRMVEMSCEEHDRHAAGSQFITHTIGRILSHLSLESTPINTKGYETLLQLKENTVSDSFDLYYGLFMYNVNATDQASCTTSFTSSACPSPGFPENKSVPRGGSAWSTS